MRHTVFETGRRFVVTVRDISVRKKTEEETANLELQNRQLQKAESLGRMAGAIAHHFNNQLQTVMLSLDLLRKDLTGGKSSCLAEDAMQAAHRAAEVSALMLTYLGQTHGKQEPLDIADVCRQALPLLQLSMPAKTELRSELPSPGPIVNSNPSQIRQILANLVTNAWPSAMAAEPSTWL